MGVCITVMFLCPRPAGHGAECREGEQRGSEGSSGRAGREAALPADPGGGAGESAQTGELLLYTWREGRGQEEHIIPRTHTRNIGGGLYSTNSKMNWHVHI